MKHISADGWLSMDPNSLLLLDNRIYVLSAGNLHMCILQYNHNHILVGHSSQNKTLELVHHEYSWSSLYANVQQFYKPCITYMQVHLSRNYIPVVISSSNYTNPPFLQHVLWQCCKYLGISSSIVKILLFNLVFHDRVTSVSVSTLKPPLGIIGAIPLKL